MRIWNGGLEHSKGSNEHSTDNLRSKQKKMTIVRIATIKSRVKVHHVNNCKYTIGEELECKLEAQNIYSSQANMVMAKEKKQKIG